MTRGIVRDLQARMGVVFRNNANVRTALLEGKCLSVDFKDDGEVIVEELSA